MNSSAIAEPEAVERSAATAPAPRRRWAGLVLVLLGIALYLSPYVYLAAPHIVPAMPTFMASMWGPALCALVLGLWWLFRGSIPWRMRLAALALSGVVIAAAMLLAHPSARFFLVMKGIPAAVGLAALGLFFAGSLRPGTQLFLGLAVIALALVPWQFMQFNGVTGQFGLDPTWRWQASSEELAASFDRERQAIAPVAASPITAGPTDWPAFRGPRQDGVASGIASGLSTAPAKELWRRPVGPGWSSCSIVGDRLFTQEQRGEEELVVCYSASTGAPLWATADPVRYSDLPSGVGPRGTPAFHDGKVYTLGATGLLNCLEASTGKRLWSVDLTKAVDATAPPFGFASSPLVVNDRVIVHSGSKTGPRLAAYDARTGAPAWQAGQGALGYSTPQLATLAGIQQVLVFNGDGCFGHDPATGKELWNYEWKAEETAPVCVQPLVLPDESIVLGGGRPGVESRRVQPTRQGEAWAVKDIWQSPFCPAFNDFVVFGDSLYGLESGRLVCIDLQTGKRRWKDGNYGAGQVLLVGDHLFVQAESGRLALVTPSPDGRQEVWRLPALSDKTWNHPAIANGKLFVRNGRELVCYDLKP